MVYVFHIKSKHFCQIVNFVIYILYIYISMECRQIKNIIRYNVYKIQYTIRVKEYVVLVYI